VYLKYQGLDANAQTELKDDAPVRCPMLAPSHAAAACRYVGKHTVAGLIWQPRSLRITLGTITDSSLDACDASTRFVIVQSLADRGVHERHDPAWLGRIRAEAHDPAGDATHSDRG